jgi:hypothetical protein
LTIDCIPSKKIIILEYADGDCSFLFKNKIDFEIIESFFCQVLIGLICLHKIVNIAHSDFKLKNILYKKIDKNIFFHYIINREHFYIPTFGYLFMIADFGIYRYQPYLKDKDMNRLLKSIDYTFIKFITLNSNIDPLTLFTTENQNILNKEIKEKKSQPIYSISKGFHFNNFSLPYLDDNELIANGINSDLIEIKKILVEKKEIIDLIKEHFLKWIIKPTINEKYIKTFIINYHK